MEDADRYIIDPSTTQDAMRRKGYHSIQDLADSLGLHRNTLGDYLSGSPALPRALAMILAALELSPVQALKSSKLERRLPGIEIAELVDHLANTAPQYSLVLYGSRARNTAKRFSDFDLGIFGQAPLSFDNFSKLLDIVEEANQNSLQTVQLVNLNSANNQFLSSIANDLIFLAGSMSSWNQLLKRCNYKTYG